MPPLDLSDPYNTALIGLLTFLLGLFVGNRFALGRDRRKERNAAAQSVHARLLKSRQLDIVETDLFMQLLPTWQRQRFSRAVERHQKAAADWQQDPTYGDITYTASATAEIQASIDALLRHTRWR